jgi:hypothetical protein
MNVQQVNLQELIGALEKLTHEDGKPAMSADFRQLVEAGLHHALMPQTLQPKAAESFQLAFEAMGGLPRLAQWADRYPASFYKLYARQTIPTITPVLPQVDKVTEQAWPEWLTHRRLAYQEEDRLQDASDADEDAV